MRLVCVNSPDQEIASCSVLSFNREDFNLDHCFLSLPYKNKLIRYEGISSDLVKKGHIGIPGFIRVHHSIPLETTIDVSVSNEVISTPLKTVVCTIRRLNPPKKEITTLHHDIVVEEIRARYAFFITNSCVCFLSSGKYFTIVPNETGVIKKETKITVFTDDPTVRMFGQTTIRKELFDPKFKFDTIGIGGLDEKLRSILCQALSTRAISQERINKLGIQHEKGLLLYGPPGTGKTLIARQLGGLLSNRQPKIINGPELLNKYIGQSEENLRAIFDEAKKDESLLVIIFDEFDALFKKRMDGGDAGTRVNDSMVNQFLTLLCGVSSPTNIFVIALTNRKDLIDPAVLRSGRIGIHFEISLPTEQGRLEILHIHTRKMEENKCLDKDVNLEQIAKSTDNFSGAELEDLVQRAVSRAVHESLMEDKEEIVVRHKHFVYALKFITPLFGNMKNEPEKLLPSQDDGRFSESLNLLLQPTDNKSFLVMGAEKSGKTSLLAKVATQTTDSYVKFLRPLSVVSLSEQGKNSLIVETMLNAYLTNRSTVIIDDIDIWLDFVQIKNIVNMSFRTYQTLATFLKTKPTEPTHKIKIIVSCTNVEIYNLISPLFDECIYLEN